MGKMAAEGQQDQVVSQEHSIQESIRREHSFEPLRVEGQLPADLYGTLYRNGPGLYELFGKAYQHMFEGDGAISAVRLNLCENFGSLRQHGPARQSMYNFGLFQSLRELR